MFNFRHSKVNCFYFKRDLFLLNYYETNVWFKLPVNSCSVEILKLKPKVQQFGNLDWNGLKALTTICRVLIDYSNTLLKFIFEARLFLYWTLLQFNWLKETFQQQKDLNWKLLDNVLFWQKQALLMETIKIN